MDEKVWDSTRAAFQTIVPISNGIQREDLTVGEVVLTQKGLVFIETRGMFSVKHVRHHAYDYDSIKAVRTESRGITGSLTGEEFLVIDIEDPGNSLTLKYSCKKDDCTRIKRTIADRLTLKSSMEQFEKELVRQIKPAAEIDLNEVAKTESVRSILTRVLNTPFPDDDIVLNAVIDKVRSFIADGVLEGVIDNSGMYTSKLSLSRKSVQYRVAIDFNGIFHSSRVRELY